MQRRRRDAWIWPKILALAALFQLLLPREAKAYIDPGSVSFFFQTLVAALLGSLFVLKNHWKSFAAKLRSFFPPKEKDDDD